MRHHGGLGHTRLRWRPFRLGDVLHHIAKLHSLPPLAVKEREFGPVGIGMELDEGWEGGGHKRRVSNQLTTLLFR